MDLSGSIFWGFSNILFRLSVDIAKVQDDEVGDGTTTVAVLGSELLKVYYPSYLCLQ